VSSKRQIPAFETIRRLLNKSPAERMDAIKATVRHALIRIGIVPEIGPRRFRRLMVNNTALVSPHLRTAALIAHDRYIHELLSDPLYEDKRRLLPFGFKVYSQNDEDGIIQEIFARIGHGSRIFVEFGVETGLENNTLKLLLEGWSGLWLEGSERDVKQINTKFSDVIAQGRLQVRNAFIDRDNLNGLIGQFHQGEIDLISIDVDGNDIHFLEALEVVSPRVIIIEYNGKFPPPMSIAQTYNAAHRWRGTDYGGSSLAAITRIAERKAYALVGCNITGVNAFFVRSDLLGDKFCPPYTAENHYQRPRYFLTPTFVAGHDPDWGSYTTI